MRVLAACERSGVVREAFRKRGHDAWSCDLAPTEDSSPFHIQGDALPALCSNWDLVIAFPPCTYLSCSGLHWNKRRPERQVKTNEAVTFFRLFTSLCCRWAIENPVGCMSRLYRKPEQIIHPHQFGHDASKQTCLWLHGLPNLTPTLHAAPRIVAGKSRWANQTDSGQNKLAPSPTRSMDRARTYQGIADAMAEQWGAL